MVQSKASKAFAFGLTKGIPLVGIGNQFQTEKMHRILEVKSNFLVYNFIIINKIWNTEALLLMPITRFSKNIKNGFKTLKVTRFCKVL